MADQIRDVPSSQPVANFVLSGANATQRIGCAFFGLAPIFLPGSKPKILATPSRHPVSTCAPLGLTRHDEVVLSCNKTGPIRCPVSASQAITCLPPAIAQSERFACTSRLTNVPSNSNRWVCNRSPVLLSQTLIRQDCSRRRATR